MAEIRQKLEQMGQSKRQHQERQNKRACAENKKHFVGDPCADGPAQIVHVFVRRNGIGSEIAVVVGYERDQQKECGGNERDADGIAKTTVSRCLFRFFPSHVREIMRRNFKFKVQSRF